MGYAGMRGTSVHIFREWCKTVLYWILNAQENKNT